MLQKLEPYISKAWQYAADAEQRAASADSPEMRAEYDLMAASWRKLALSFEFVQSLELFLIDRDRAKDASPPEPPAAIG